MTARRAVVCAVTALLAVLALLAPAALAAPPRISAPAAIVVEPATKDIVFQRRADKRVQIASTTKMMTALVAVDALALDDVLTTVPYAGLPGESILGVPGGKRMTVRDLLRALLLVSANDVAQTLAVRVAGSVKAFVRLMNDKARALGLKDTHFANPIGLDSPENYSTASDLAKLALIVRENRFLRRTVDLPRATVKISGAAKGIANRNTLVRSTPFVSGVKTGHTNAAGYILVGSGTRDGITAISVVLGTPSEAARNADTLALLRYGTDRYQIVTALKEGTKLGAAKLKYRDESVDLVAARSVRRTIRRGERTFVRVVGAPKEVEGPLDQGARVGTVLVRWRGRTIERVPLVTAQAVSEATAMQRLKEFLGRSGTIFALAALVGCSLVLLLLRRRITRRGGGTPREAGVA